MAGSLWISLAAVALCATGAPVTMTLSEDAAWLHQGPATGSELVPMIFAVRQTGIEWLEAELMRVSDPKSPFYGQHHTLESLATRVHGVPESVEYIEGMLAARATNVRKQMDHSYIFADILAADMGHLMECQPQLYRHATQDLTVARCLQAPVPDHLSPHVDFVLGHGLLPDLQRFEAKAYQPLTAPEEVTTPQLIDKTYKLGNYTSSARTNSQAVASFLGQYFRKEDLESFQKKFNLPVKPIAKVVGVNVDFAPGMEANLDVEYIGATGRGVVTWFVSTAQRANHGQEDFLTWMSGQLNDTKSPWVHSVSYGDVESSIDDSYKTRVNDDFMKFGVSGRTILVAAGDSGVSCTNDKFAPDWPTSSPYITSVGGTSGVPERVWSDGGGGFSNFYAQPTYQADAVKAYMNSGKAPASRYFNASGRAYPDVSAFATNFEIAYMGSFVGVDGTSCATPTFAGVVAQLNDVRILAGKSPLGFLNPLLYQAGGSDNGFNDVIQGSNPDGACPGFEASTGWDPASGWGSPDFSQLKQIVA
ncbi:uncharacterized protein MONBRDRAFT_37973 [Monosiga brevicollis MX1]|uniref:Peptidase S53 domain-containing protein n=1 Tax=Monosiga brevicollis TaxID=81824 RepID=A9V4Z1_MONBE|nr:uncharacterized protein MONBRDRAFT_37973 [Monosiga brevicollis MX1]EDQ87539.1 predicted protein [Monosiga brevicollis MX1]|eukprot:XP_001747799.1 hypothetical protein [Monosiga brevicollis MX1]